MSLRLRHLLPYALACALAALGLLAVLWPAHEAGAQRPPAPTARTAAVAPPVQQEGGETAATTRGGPLPGEHDWERVFYGQWEGKEALLYNSSIFYGKLTFGDLDGDGDLDLLVGKQDGRIDRFDNVGSNSAPHWRLVQENIVALPPRQEGSAALMPQVIETGAHAAPALVDIDQDGDLDLFVGTADGRLMFYRNVGNPRLAVFALVSSSFVARGFGTNLVPTFTDVDGNRSPDLVIANRSGDIYLLVNQGTQRRAAYCVEFPRRDALPDEEPPCRPVPRHLVSVAPENHSAAALVDWDGDGDVDLFVGMSNGTIDYFENHGTRVEPDWRLRQRRFLAIDEGGYAAPAFTDLNGDGRPELVIGSSTNNVSVYSNKDTKSVLDVWKVTGNVLDVRRLGLDLRQLVVTSGDLDGDGDRDLLVGDRGGRLLWLENTGTKNDPAWRVKQSHVLAGTLREGLAPCLVDLDGDGDLDLLIGGEDGRVWLMRNVGTPKEPQFSLETTNYSGIDVGNDSVPVAIDIDGDGDVDLVVGNRRGLAILFLNNGTPAKADFQLANTRLGETSMPQRAVPAFLDWNGDGKPDLILGARAGNLALVLNENEKGSADLKAWKVAANPWHVFRSTGFSAPHVADFNGDGRPDLLIGDADGNLQLWLDRGAMPTGALAASAPAASAADAGAVGVTAGAPAQTTGPGGIGRPNFESQSGLSALLAPGPAGGQPGSSMEGPGASGLAGGLTAPVATGPLEPIFVAASTELGGIKTKGRVRPAIGDVDGDGKVDLVIGTPEGKLNFLRNTGTRAEPAWTLAAENLGEFDAGGNPSPLLVDLDGDGKVDLLVGTEQGQVLFFKNEGKNDDNGAPVFTRLPEALANVNVGRNAAPAVGPVNGDADSDLIIGEFSGHLWAFVREGGARSLNFKLVDRRFLGIDVGVAATPYVGDIDRDGKLDLLVGSDQGRVSLFSQVKPDKKHPQGWAQGKDYFKDLKFPFGTTPRLVDLDGDGDVDLVLGTEKGTLYYFRNDALNPPPGASQ